MGGFLITDQDAGRIAVRRNGSTTVIQDFNPDGLHPVKCRQTEHTWEGWIYPDGREDELDLVAWKE